ncbi:30S ribosomal protein S6 [Pyrinomonas sp.]|uniref:30S ribosomal protein S6 n=1 Tax=Pyrinomonas sp. TaxID=2080306 RepID=UPI003317AABB
MADKRVYEILFIVDPNTNDEDLARLSESLQQTITEQGGVVTKAENLGRRTLAYEINHRTEGTYMLFEIEGSGREIAELERRMRVSDVVMRFMTVRVDRERKRAEKLRERRARKAGRRAGVRPTNAAADAAESSEG